MGSWYWECLLEAYTHEKLFIKPGAEFEELGRRLHPHFQQGTLWSQIKW